MNQQVFKEVHAKYLRRILKMLSCDSSMMDSIRLTIAYFAISGLDILDSLNEFSVNEKNAAIDWIYKLQITNAGRKSGFLASTTLPIIESNDYIIGHLAMTYTGLASLLILGDDLSRIDRSSFPPYTPLIQHLHCDSPGPLQFFRETLPSEKALLGNKLHSIKNTFRTNISKTNHKPIKILI